MMCRNTYHRGEKVSSALIMQKDVFMIYFIYLCIISFILILTQTVCIIFYTLISCFCVFKTWICKVITKAFIEMYRSKHQVTYTQVKNKHLKLSTTYHHYFVVNTADYKQS